jgi:membrane-associated protease RseP (regulator of RpoE activity)
MSFEILSRIGLLILFVTLLVSVSNLGMAVACWIGGVRVTEIVLFSGKPVFTIKTRFCPIKIGYIPTGGYIKPDVDAFPKKNLLTRCLVNLAGPVSIFITSLICLGFLHTAASFQSTYSQLLGIVLSPMTYGKSLIGGYLAHAQAAPIAGYGILAAKNAALSLLPLPAISGGRLLLELTKKRDDSRLAKLITLIGTLFALAVFISLAVAMFNYFFRNN